MGWPLNQLSPPSERTLDPQATPAPGAAAESFGVSDAGVLQTPSMATKLVPAEQPPAAAPSQTSLTITSPPGSDPQKLELELAAACEELKALHEMLEDLPEIFERKFQQRLASVMEHQKHLLADNHALRERLYSVPASEVEPPSPRIRPLLFPTVPQEAGWRQSLRKALRLDRSGKGGRSGKATSKGINRHDDERPISA
jgi:hypothetical protein